MVADPELVTAVAQSWRVPADAPLRVVALDPKPVYPWSAVWRADSLHPSLTTVLVALRSVATATAGELSVASGPSAARP